MVLAMAKRAAWPYSVLVGSYIKYCTVFVYHRHCICTPGKLNSIYKEVFT